MSPKNSSQEKLVRPIDLLLDKYRPRQQQIPTLIHRSVSRRNFLLAGSIGAAAMTMSPFERALASYRFPGVEHAFPPPDGFFDFVLGIGRVLAHALGFGMYFETAYGIVKYFFGDQPSRQNAKSGLDEVAQEIWDKRDRFLGLIPLGRPVSQGGQPVKTTFAFGNAQTAGLQRRMSGVSLAHALPPVNDKRFYAMALANNSMNSLIPIFNYNDPDNRYGARAVVGIPTLQTFNSILANPTLLTLYTKAELERAVYPSRQSDTYKAYGIWEEDYQKQDRFETAAGTTLEFEYKYLGRYTGDGVPAGAVRGRLTTKLGGFRSGSPSKFVDTYCWVSGAGEMDSCPG